MSNKQVALITGANQGIGLQIAKDLVSHGFTVLVGSRNFERGESAAKEVGPDAHALQLDVTDPASIAAAASHLRSAFGRLDVLVNNAAISNTSRTPGMSIADYAAKNRASAISLDEVRAIFETNVFGVLAVTQAMLPLLREAPQGRIVNVSSGVGSLTRTSDPAYPWRSIFGPGYAASKTALNAMTLAMAIELEGTAIKVNAVSPGYTKTNLNGYSGTETVEQGAAEAVRLALIGRRWANRWFLQLRRDDSVVMAGTTPKRGRHRERSEATPGAGNSAVSGPWVASSLRSSQGRRTLGDDGAHSAACGSACGAGCVTGAPEWSADPLRRPCRQSGRTATRGRCRSCRPS